MVDRHVVVARLAKIREYVALLRKIRDLATESQFVADPIVYAILRRELGDFETFIRAVSRRL